MDMMKAQAAMEAGELALKAWLGCKACHSPACMPIGAQHGEPCEGCTWASLRQGLFQCVLLLTHAEVSTSAPMHHERCQDRADVVPGTPDAAAHNGAHAHPAPLELSSAPAHGAGVTGEPTPLCWARLTVLGRCLLTSRNGLPR